MSRKQTEEEAVEALAAPEADAALSSRHAKRTWTGVIGTLVILGSGVSVLLRGAGGEWGNVPEILAACLGGACLIASRLYSDAHRVGKLANHQQELLAIQAKIDELASGVADWDHSAQAQVAAFEGRVGKASVGLPPRSATASMADILQHFIDAVQQGENSWRARHGEISLVAKS